MLFKNPTTTLPEKQVVPALRCCDDKVTVDAVTEVILKNSCTEQFNETEASYDSIQLVIHSDAEHHRALFPSSDCSCIMDSDTKQLM